MNRTINATTSLSALLLLWLVLPAGAHAQPRSDDGTGREAHAEAEPFAALHAHGSPAGPFDELEPPPATAAPAGQAVMAWLGGLSSVGSAAWPTVRRYLWDACFAGDELFTGYAVSRPGKELDSLTFLIMIDRDLWTATRPEVRQAAMLRAQECFDRQLAELALEGTLEIVLQSR